jgi:hypothetical protein
MRQPFLPSAAAVLLSFTLPLASPAQDKKNFEVVKFDTVDQVEIRGTYWPSTRGKKAPVAMLLHKIGGKSNEDGWKDLADELQKAGFAVLSFDFRGHGASISVTESFWNHPMNRTLRRKVGKAAETIALSEFPGAYLPNLVNDITAAKRFLERRYNDGGDCNISNLVLIGAEDGATLGALWLASEVRRYRIEPVGLVGKRADTAEIKDLVACVWLNMSNYIGSGRQSVAAQYLKTWLKDAGTGKDAKVPMAFYYGEEDRVAANNAVGYVRAIRPKFVDAKSKLDDGLTGTNIGVIPGSKLVGAKLLTIPKARETIVKKYLESFILDEKKGLAEWEKRESEKAVYGWYFGVGNPILTNAPGEKHSNPIPLTQFGFR